MPPSAKELTERETALNDRAEALDLRDAGLTTRETELDERERIINDASKALDERAEALAAEVAAFDATRGEAVLEGTTDRPEPAEGAGLALIELPLDLVGVLASVHPSERVSIGSRIAGTLRQALAETGKLRPGVAHADYAELVTGGEGRLGA